jgi:integrase
VSEGRHSGRSSQELPFVFVSERGASLTGPPGFFRMVERAAIAVNLSIKAHAHMLRHACGYKLANDGHDTRPTALPRAPPNTAHGALPLWPRVHSAASVGGTKDQHRARPQKKSTHPRWINLR